MCWAGRAFLLLPKARACRAELGLRPPPGAARPPPSTHTASPQLTCPRPLRPPALPPPRSAFNEVYLPWLNCAELPAQRLDLEFATLHSYLRLAGGGGMGWAAVRGLMAAYVRAVVAKAAQR